MRLINRMLPLSRFTLKTMHISELTLGPGPCGLRAGLAPQGGGHDLRGKVEEVSQVLDTFVGEVPVEMTPGKLLLDIPTGLQGLGGKHKHVVFTLDKVQQTHECKLILPCRERRPDEFYRSNVTRNITCFPHLSNLHLTLLASVKAPFAFVSCNEKPNHIFPRCAFTRNVERPLIQKRVPLTKR